MSFDAGTEENWESCSSVSARRPPAPVMDTGLETAD